MVERLPPDPAEAVTLLASVPPGGMTARMEVCDDQHSLVLDSIENHGRESAHECAADAMKDDAVLRWPFGKTRESLLHTLNEGDAQARALTLVTNRTPHRSPRAPLGAGQWAALAVRACQGLRADLVPGHHVLRR
jgi:hypothetical protein